MKEKEQQQKQRCPLRNTCSMQVTSVPYSYFWNQMTDCFQCKIHFHVRTRSVYFWNFLLGHIYSINTGTYVQQENMSKIPLNNNT
jgi:hypothetical protein